MGVLSIVEGDGEMSSFPEHVENIKKLSAIGFDVSEAMKDGEVSLESWGYDELTYLLGEVIHELERQNFFAWEG